MNPNDLNINLGVNINPPKPRVAPPKYEPVRVAQNSTWSQYQNDVKNAPRTTLAAPKLSITLSPDRQIQISAPKYYLDSPEFKKQVLPQFNQLVGKSINDNAFKALMNSDFVKQVKGQAEQIYQRQNLIYEYQKKFPKATDDDALTYFRNLAAAERSDKDENTQIVIGTKADGTPDTRSVKEALENFKTYNDKQKGEMVQNALKSIENPKSEFDRAVNQSLLDFFKKKGALDAGLQTKVDRAIGKGLAEFSKSFTGKVLSAPADIVLGLFNKGGSVEDLANKQLNSDPTKNLEGADSLANIAGALGDISGQVSDIVVPGTAIGKGLTAGGKILKTGATTALENGAPKVAIELGGRSIEVPNTVKAVVAQVPSDIGYGVTQAMTRDDYKSVDDFVANTALNAGTLGIAKVVGRTLSKLDTASNQGLTRANEEVTKKVFQAMDKVQGIPGIGKLQKAFTFNYIDSGSDLKRAARNAIANSKGAKETKDAKEYYYEVSNAIRQSSMQGAPEAHKFRSESPSFVDAINANKALMSQKQLDAANEWVTDATILDRAEAGQYEINGRQLEELRARVEANRTPEFEDYRDKLAAVNEDITKLSNSYGLTDEEIVKAMEADPNFADKYVHLQFDVKSGTNLPIGKVGNGRSLKSATPVKGIKGRTTDPALDLLTSANDRLQTATQMAVRNRVAQLVKRGIDEGYISGQVTRDALQVGERNHLKFRISQEKQAVTKAVEGQMTALETDLRRLTDDLEDFAGTGETVMRNRIAESVDTMMDDLLDDPRIGAEIERLRANSADSIPDAQYALEILDKHRKTLSKQIGEALIKSNLGKEERDQVVNMFEDEINKLVTRSTNAEGMTTGVADKFDEIKRLNADIDGKQSGDNIIEYFENGHKGQIELTDPEVARYFNSRTTKGEDNWFQKIMSGSSRVFRYATTGVNPVFLLVNPARDLPQSAITSGIDVLSPRNTMKTLMETQGMSAQQAEQVMQELDSRFKDSFRFSTQVATAREPQRAYKKLMEEARHYDATTTGEKIKAHVVDLKPGNGTFRKLEDVMGGIELVTRKNVFQARLNSALKRGLNVEEATSEALFHAANATTDFLNVGNKVGSFVRTVPYLTAAINGKASFLRLWALDPIGVTSRLAAGIVAPVTYLTTRNLSDPELSAGYFNVPEYVRKTNFVIMLDKDNYLAIPMSYELASVVNPFRERIEAFHGMNNLTFNQTMVKSFLGSLPVDLSGFASQNYAGETNTGQAVSQAISSFLPQAARPIYETVSGRDMYTDQALNPTDQELIDRGQVNAGDEITPGDRTYKSRNSQLLGAIANITGLPQGTIQSYVNNYGGTVGQFLLNGIDKVTGAPPEAQGGKDVLETTAKRFLGTPSDLATQSYYQGIDKLQDERELVLSRLNRLDQDAQFASDPAQVADSRQKIIDEYGAKVADFANTFGEYYQRAGGFKPYQLDGLVKLLNLGPQNGAFAEGSYQQGMLNDVQQEAQNDAVRRATDLGIPATSNRDLFGRIFKNEGTGELNTDYSNTNLYNSNIRSSVYGAPKQIAYDFAQATKADKKSGLPSLYDIKSRFDDKISALYDEAAKIPKADKARKTAKFDEISEMQKKYMQEFDKRVKPLINKYGVEALAESKVFDEISAYVVVPGEMTPYFSKKKTPYLKQDAKAYLLDRYGIGRINQRNRMTDPEVQARIQEINTDLKSGRTQAASYKLSKVEQQISEGKTFVDGPTMEKIADMVYNLNSYKKRR